MQKGTQDDSHMFFYDYNFREDGSSSSFVCFSETFPYANLSTPVNATPVRVNAPAMIRRGGTICHGMVLTKKQVESKSNPNFYEVLEVSEQHYPDHRLYFDQRNQVRIIVAFGNDWTSNQNKKRHEPQINTAQQKYLLPVIHVVRLRLRYCILAFLTLVCSPSVVPPPPFLESFLSTISLSAH